MSKKSLSYRDSGVDIKKGDDFVKIIAPMAAKTFHQYVHNDIGGFASVASIPKHLKEPMIVTSTDGVGTKLLLSQTLNDYTDIGQDLVAMCVNDLLTIGAKPFLFLDYFACESIVQDQAVKIIESIAKACQRAGCALVGGETAEMPGLYKKNDFDLSGFCVGLVDKANIVDGPALIKPGDCILALPSSGFHSNGFSLIRNVIDASQLDLNKIYEGFDLSLGQLLLKGTTIYVDEVFCLIDQGIQLHGMAHITGGGIAGNLSRILPEHCMAHIDSQSWTPPALFKFIQNQGNIDQDEMFKTFNMGLGYIIVSAAEDKQHIQQCLPDIIELGKIVEGRKKTQIV